MLDDDEVFIFSHVPCRATLVLAEERCARLGKYFSSSAAEAGWREGPNFTSSEKQNKKKNVDKKVPREAGLLENDALAI
jgi:hypothetical protein